jgi:PHD/YefM family antitoxin component YafN of YafNO toxin-antitoxin module
LTRFNTNLGEFLDIATTQPVILTSHGRERYVVADSDYFRHLERVVRRKIADHLHIEAIASSEMNAADKQALANARPTTNALANNRWED